MIDVVVPGTVVATKNKMSSLQEVLAQHSWPIGFETCITQSKEIVAMRFVIVDNSRSMLKRDGHRLTKEGKGTIK